MEAVSSAPAPASDNRTVQLNPTKLADLRRARGLTRERLAEQSTGAHRLSEATIKRAEHGERVYLETARRLASMLEVTLEDLVSDEGEPGPSTAPYDAPAASRHATQVAVAVLPFRAIGDDAVAQRLADGIAEDLATRLGRWWFPVVCRGSTAHYPSRPTSISLVDDLQVAYIVEGSVQYDGDAIRVQARLLAAATAQQLWAAEYNRPLSGLFALQDQLTAGIIDGVNHKLLHLVERRLEQLVPEDMDGWQLAMAGAHAFHRGTRDTNLTARKLLRRAIQRDRGMPFAFYLLGMTYQRELINQWSPTPRESIAGLSEASAECDRSHPGDAYGEVLAAYLHVYGGERERAADRLARAIEWAPNLKTAYSLLGQTLAMEGNPARALEQFELAMRLSPRDSELWSVRTGVALTHFVAEDYASACRWAAEASQLRPDTLLPMVTLAAATALQGDVPGAKRVVGELCRVHPNLSAERLYALSVSTDPAIANRFREGLRLAGLGQ